jgi:hypothetical protein
MERFCRHSRFCYQWRSNFCPGGIFCLSRDRGFSRCEVGWARRFATSERRLCFRLSMLRCQSTRPTLSVEHSAGQEILLIKQRLIEIADAIGEPRCRWSETNCGACVLGAVAGRAAVVVTTSVACHCRTIHSIDLRFSGLRKALNAVNKGSFTRVKSHRFTCCPDGTGVGSARRSIQRDPKAKGSHGTYTKKGVFHRCSPPRFRGEGLCVWRLAAIK